VKQELIQQLWGIQILPDLVQQAKRIPSSCFDGRIGVLSEATLDDVLDDPW
jgi:hypothetical protein